VTASNPPRSCPAQNGAGADIAVSYFTFAVGDCEQGPDRMPARTEVRGFFRQPGDHHDQDVLITATLLVPTGSPIAVMVHQVVGDELLTRRVEAALRANIRRCRQCRYASAAGCPALDESHLVEAIERTLAGSGP